MAACNVCSRSKASHRPPAGLLRPLPIPGRPWSDVALDFVTGLPTSKGNNTILTIVDRFSKMVHFIALPKLPSVAETVDLFTTYVIRLHVIPCNIVSDRGPQFTARVWQAFCHGIGSTASLSSGYHPQTNGQAERANQALEATLHCVTTSNPASWSLHVPWVEYSLNTMVSAATGLSPFQCSLGYQPPLFPSQEMEAAVPSVRAHLRRCRRVWKVGRDSMLQSRDRVQWVTNRWRVPAPAYRLGQRVWLLAKDLPLPAVSCKLAPRYISPYTILKVFNPSALRLQLPSSLKVHPVFHISQVKPVADCGLSPPTPAPPPPRILESGNMVWEVNRILVVRRRGPGAPGGFLPSKSPSYRAVARGLPWGGGSWCGSSYNHAPRSNPQHEFSCWGTISQPAAAATPPPATISRGCSSFQDDYESLPPTASWTESFFANHW